MFPSVMHWYYADSQSGDAIHELITDTMMKNRVQATLILVVDLLTDIALLLSVKVSRWRNAVIF